MSDENSIVENVKLATKAIRSYFSRRILGDISLIEYCNELTRDYIGNAVVLWAGHTYVGIPKQKRVQEAFQERRYFRGRNQGYGRRASEVYRQIHQRH